MQLSVGITTFGAPPSGSWRTLLDVARAADDVGIDRLVVSDHVVLGPHTDDYPWGRFPTGPTDDWLEPLTAIAALAAVTSRVRFLTGILIAALRPPALLAKTVATADVLADGRLDLGVGVGWQREEFDAVGLDFAARGALLDRAIADCRTLWSGAPLPVVGTDGVASEVWCAPVPAQDRLPVWFSGTLNARNVRRIVELGDGWIPLMGAAPADLADGVATLRTALAGAGRGPEALAVRASPAIVRRSDGSADATASFADLGELAAAGATDLHVPLRPFVGDAGPAAAMADLASAFAAARGA